MIDIDLVNVDFDISKDKEHTTKYLNDLNNQTPFSVLDNTYTEHLRAVLNYSPILKVREPFMGCIEPPKIEPTKPNITPIDLTSNSSARGEYYPTGQYYSFSNYKLIELMNEHGFTKIKFQEKVGDDWVDGIHPADSSIPDTSPSYTEFYLRADGSIFAEVVIGAIYNATIRAVTADTSEPIVLGEGRVFHEITANGYN